MKCAWQVDSAYALPSLAIKPKWKLNPSCSVTYRCTLTNYWQEVRTVHSGINNRLGKHLSGVTRTVSYFMWNLVGSEESIDNKMDALKERKNNTECLPFLEFVLWGCFHFLWQTFSLQRAGCDGARYVEMGKRSSCLIL